METLFTSIRWILGKNNSYVNTSSSNCKYIASYIVLVPLFNHQSTVLSFSFSILFAICFHVA